MTALALAMLDAARHGVVYIVLALVAASVVALILAFGSRQRSVMDEFPRPAVVAHCPEGWVAGERCRLHRVAHEGTESMPARRLGVLRDGPEDVIYVENALAAESSAVD